MKNVVQFENQCGAWELERGVARLEDDYNHELLYEALGNVTPDDICHDNRRSILSRAGRGSNA